MKIPLGCCFNLSRYKAIERVEKGLKLRRIARYNRVLTLEPPLPRSDHDPIKLYESQRDIRRCI